MPEDKPNFEQLSDELQAGNKKTLRYSRMRFLLTWLAIALLAIISSLSIIFAVRNAETNLEQTDDIARVANTTAENADASTEDITAYLRGEQGIPGVPGANGVDGTPGQPSSQPGPAGPRGQQGDVGPAGSVGSPGPAGPSGPMGQTGSIGPIGPVGTGEPGVAGEPGPPGEQGPKGEKGDEGARGAEGPTGPMGPQGPQGPPGTTPPLTRTIQIAQSPNDTTTHKVVTVECPAGSFATGGGFAVVPSNPGIIPTASSPAGNGWSATVDQLSLPPGTNWQVLVFAVCMS